MSSPARRRVATAAAATLLITPLASCGSDSGGSSGPLRVTANVTDRSSMDAVVSAFRESHPDIEVEVTYADTDTQQRSLGKQLAGGEGPDVFTVWPGNGNPASVQALEADGHLWDLSAREFASQVPDGARPVTEVDRHAYVVPVNYSGIGVIYSKRALAALGAEEPKEWKDLLKLCRTAQENGTVLLALGNRTPWVTQLISYALAATTVYASTPDFDEKMRDADASFAGSGWTEAFSKYLEMNEQGCFNDLPLETTYEKTLQMVSGGRAVGVVQVASSLAELQAASPDAQFGFFALPAGNDAERTRMPGAVSAAYGVNAHSGRLDDALVFADFLGSAEGQNLYNRGGATLPAIPNDEFEASPALAELTERQRGGTTVPFMDQLWPHPGVQQQHFAQVKALFDGSATPEQAAAALDRAYRTRPQ